MQDILSSGDDVFYLRSAGTGVPLLLKIFTALESKQNVKIDELPEVLGSEKKMSNLFPPEAP